MRTVTNGQNVVYVSAIKTPHTIIMHNNQRTSYSTIARNNRIRILRVLSESLSFFAFESADDELNRFVSFGVYGVKCVICRQCIEREWKKRENTLDNVERETMISARYYKYVSLTRLNVRLLNIF